MDVFAGQFQAWRTMTARYNELEPRYAMAGTYDGVTVFLTSWQEILIQTPCGLALFYAYWRGSNWKHGLEIIFNMWSVAGVWYFYGSEFVLGFPHIHAPWGAAEDGGDVEAVSEDDVGLSPAAGQGRGVAEEAPDGVPVEFPSVRGVQSSGGR